MVRIAIFGAGTMARKHLETYALLRRARVAGVSWAGAEGLRAVEREYGVPVFADPDALICAADAVDVCLPTPLHECATLRAAAAGRHVLCEKPIALSLAAARRMRNTCRRAGVVLMTAHCLRFHPEYTWLKRAVDEKQYGALLSLELERFSALPRWGSRDWLADAERSGGATVDLHIHDADMALFLLGPPKSTRARETVSEGCFAVDAEYEYRGGPAVRARGGWILDGEYPFHMSYRAVFERAVAEYDSRRAPTLTVYGKGRPAHPRLPARDGYYYQLKHFIECAKSGKQPVTSTAEDGMAALALVLAERESARTGKRIGVRGPEFGVREKRKAKSRDLGVGIWDLGKSKKTGIRVPEFEVRENKRKKECFTAETRRTQRKANIEPKNIEDRSERR